MPEVSAYPPGTPSWIDLGTPDVDVAAAFYGGLFGWEVNDLGPDAGGYRMASYRGRDAAGLGPQMAPGPSYWTTYVTVADADAAAETIAAAGGTTLVPPMQVLTVGKMAVFQDPTGAAFSVWEPQDHIGSGIVNEPNTLTWNELNTRDPAAAKDFYTKAFGWTYTVDPEGDGSYTLLQLDGRTVGGLLAMDENFPPEVPAHWMIYFGVDDTDATVAKAQAAGGALVMGPIDVPVGRFAVLSDPAGAVFTVIQATTYDPPPG